MPTDEILTLEIEPPYIGSAVSPTVDIDETTDDITVTITDFRGEHSYTVEKTDQAIANAEQAAQNANDTAQTVAQGWTSKLAEINGTLAQQREQMGSAATAESQRVTAENLRVNAENAREQEWEELSTNAAAATSAANEAAGQANTAAQGAIGAANAANDATTRANNTITGITQTANQIFAQAGQATIDANAAAQSANTAATNANTKAGLADTAAQNADAATTAANNAATTATTAAKAADTAREGIQSTVDEVEDIRTAYDGVVYASAGDAVRGQISNLENEFTSIAERETISEKITKTSPLLTTYETRGYIDPANGQLYPNNNYQIYYYTVDVTDSVWFDSNEDWCQFAVYRGTFLTQTGLVTVVRNNVESFPMSSNKYTNLQVGDIVAICIQVGSSHDFSYNLSYLGNIKLTDETIADIEVRTGIEHVDDVVSDISELNYTIIDKNADALITYATNGYIGSSGSFVENNIYKVYYFTAPADCYAWFEPTDNFTRLVIYDGELFSTSDMVAYYKNGDNLPIENSKCTLIKGQTIAISIGAGTNDNFQFHYANGYIIKSNSKMPLLKYRQLTGTSDPQIYYSDKAPNVLSLYIPSEAGYIQFNIGKSSYLTQAEGGYDVTRMCVLYATDNNFTKKFDITRPGEWEMAVKISGQDDFIGGYEHGDEWETSVQYFIDGKLVDITEYTGFTEFEEVKIKSVSNMYLPADHETLVGIHGKEWVITKESAVLYQSIQWQFEQDTDMTASFMTMFPAIRGNDSISEEQITSKFFDDVNFATRDCSVYGFNGDMSKNTRKVTLYSTESGFFGNVEVIDYPSYPDSAYVYLSNRENQSNKIYYGVCGYGNTRGTVTPNQVWKSKSIYRFNLVEGTN